jgi:putative ABC transport system permease protein
VGSAVAVTGAVAVASVTASADRLLSSPDLWGASWDAGGIVEAEQGDAVAEMLAADPDVEAAALGLSMMNPGAFSAVGPDGPVVLEPFAFQPVKGEMGPVVTAGRAPVGPDEAVVGADLADMLGIGVGDSFQIDTPRQAVDVTMVGELVFPGADTLGDRLVLSPAGMDVLREGCPPDDADLSCAMPFAELGVRYRPGVDRAEVTERLEAQGLSLEEPTPPSEVNNLEQIGVTPWLLAGFLALLGLAGLAHALVVGSRRQRRDLAVTRVLGLRPRQAAAVVRWQAVILASLGTAAGLLVGVVVGRLLWRRIAISIGAPVSVDLSPWVLVLVPVAVGAALLIGLLPAQQAARRRPAEVLRSE